jgi:Fe-S-cluster containining protein
MSTGTKQSCTCEKCVAACKYKPGWFKPGEMEKAAQLLGITPKEFFDKYLHVEYWEGDEQSGNKDVFILAPIPLSCEPGIMADYRVATGTCIFLKDGKCSIHFAKPYECREMIHDVSDAGPHEEAMAAWNNDGAQRQIAELLGHEPEIPEHSFLDGLLGFLGQIA